jgi:multicomponent Na+:H+ antiporter subunit D
MPPWGIEYVVDPLSAGMAVLISGMALLTMVYAAGCLDKENSRHPGLSEALFLLLTAGLLGIVMTGDMFNLYVFLEISSIAA